MRRIYRWALKSAIRNYDALRVLRSRYFVIRYRGLRRRTSNWRPFRNLALMVLVAVAILLLVALTIAGYSAPWTGFGAQPLTPAAHQTPPKLLWDWLQLCVVPALLAIAAYYFSRTQDRARTQAADSQRAMQSLGSYLDRMADLLLAGNLLGSPPDSEPRIVANALTSTVLPTLSTSGKAEVLTFLKEAGLIQRKAPIVSARRLDFSRIDLYPARLDQVDLRATDFRGAHMPWGNFYDSYLSSCNFELADLESAQFHKADLNYSLFAHADMFEADLRDAQLIKAILVHANLSRARLANAQLRSADLENANLSYADLTGTNLKAAKLIDANLHGAVLAGADLSLSTLWGADLRDADLSGCDLTDAYVTWRQLRKARTVRGAKLSRHTK